jgi:hypothetical protein
MKIDSQRKNDNCKHNLDDVTIHFLVKIGEIENYQIARVTYSGLTLI